MHQHIYARLFRLNVKMPNTQNFFLKFAADYELFVIHFSRKMLMKLTQGHNLNLAKRGPKNAIEKCDTCLDFLGSATTNKTILYSIALPKQQRLEQPAVAYVKIVNFPKVHMHLN